MQACRFIPLVRHIGPDLLLAQRWQCRAQRDDRMAPFDAHHDVARARRVRERVAAEHEETGLIPVGQPPELPVWKDRAWRGVATHHACNSSRFDISRRDAMRSASLRAVFRN